MQVYNSETALDWDSLDWKSSVTEALKKSHFHGTERERSIFGVKKELESACFWVGGRPKQGRRLPTKRKPEPLATC